MNSMCEILFTIMTPAVHVRDVPELNKQLEYGVKPKTSKPCCVGNLRLLFLHKISFSASHKKPQLLKQSNTLCTLQTLTSIKHSRTQCHTFSTNETVKNCTLEKFSSEVRSSLFLKVQRMIWSCCCAWQQQQLQKTFSPQRSISLLCSASSIPNKFWVLQHSPICSFKTYKSF